MRNPLVTTLSLAVLLTCLSACGDDDSQNNNTNQNNQNAALCGNGQVELGEACDEGDQNSDAIADACRTDCRNAYCGDGVLDSDEGCDDGNIEAQDGCSPGCEVETGWDCTGGTCTAVCGDGLAVGPETCDGSDLKGMTCVGLGQAAGELACTGLCDWDISDCTGVAVCGNGTVQAGEQCDDGNQTSCDGCSSTCRLEVCGNGVVDCLEVCDQGGETAACNANCTASSCGDGVLNTTAGESCDDAGTANGDGCDASCAVEAGWVCAGSPSVCTAAQCGDGVVAGTEACDDGNSVGGDGCDAGCAEETGWVCTGNPSVCGAAQCGDGIMAGTETCDDGNSTVGDGCDAGCAEEAGWVCTGSPSVCGAALCGDGFRAGTEVCDNGALNSDTVPDACRTDCELAHCGDGVKDTADGCDDGNGVDGDGCSTSCAVEPGWTCQGSAPSLCYMGIFVTLSSGVFTMGAPVTEPARQPSETQHVVTLSGSFEMQTTEVSQEQFQAVLGYDPSTFAGCATCPVETVTWHEAAAYCNGLSGQAGFPTCFTCSGTLPNVTCDLDTTWATPYACTGFRLPTEAEWEYAARAGTTAGTYNGTSVLTSCETPNPVLDPIAWYCGNATFSTQAAGGKAANPWGLYDMLGNVWEWVHDWSDPYPGNVTDPWGPATGSYRVFRGGSFGHEAQAARAAARAEDVPSARVNVYGFRPVRSQ